MVWPSVGVIQGLLHQLTVLTAGHARSMARMLQNPRRMQLFYRRVQSKMYQSTQVKLYFNIAGIFPLKLNVFNGFARICDED